MYHQELVRTLKDEVAAKLGRGRYRSAVAGLRRLCDLQPNDGMHRVRLGNALLKMGRSKEALQAFREAVNVFLRSYDYPQALAASRLVLDIDPTHEGAHQVRQEMVERCPSGTDKFSVLAMLAQQEISGRTEPLEF